jgi:hypothetical protein
LRTELLATIKSHSTADHDPRSPNQQRRHAIPRLPPFIEAALSSDTKAKTAVYPTTATISTTTTCPSNGPSTASTGEVRNSKPKRSASRPIAELIGTDDVQESLIPINHSNQPKDMVQTLSDVTIHGKLGHGDTLQPAASDKASPESRNVLRDLPRNQRPRSHNKNGSGSISKHGTSRFPSDGLANRPLPDHQLQPQDLRYNQAFHNTRDSGVSKRILSRANSPHYMQPNYRIPTGGNEQVNAAGLLHMATVMLTVEKEQLNKVVADAELQEAQIEDLSKENAALHDHIKSLSEDNQKLLAKNAGFRTRCEQYKAKMNDVMRIQKELKVDAKNLNRRQFEILAEAGKEMDAELLEAKSQVLKGSRAILKEARLEINRRKVKIGS